MEISSFVLVEATSYILSAKIVHPISFTETKLCSVLDSFLFSKDILTILSIFYMNIIKL